MPQLRPLRLQIALVVASRLHLERLPSHDLEVVAVEADYLAVNDDTRAMLHSYTAGVNAFISTTRSLPIEYRLLGTTPEEWQPWDCVAVYKVRHILMGVFESKLWRAQLVNTFGPEKAASLLSSYQQGHLLIV